MRHVVEYQTAHRERPHIVRNRRFAHPRKRVVRRTELQRDEGIEPARLVLLLTKTHKVAYAVSDILDMSVEHRRVGVDAHAVRRRMESEPLLGCTLLRAYPVADVRIENLGSSARDGLHTRLFQHAQPLLGRDSRLAYHVVEFHGGKRLDADVGQLLTDTANHLGIIVYVVVGVYAADDMHFGRTAVTTPGSHGDHLVHRVVPCALLATFAAERAELALQHADIRRLDMEIAVIEHLVAADATFRLRSERTEQPQRGFPPQRQRLVGGNASAAAQFGGYRIDCHHAI